MGWTNGHLHPWRVDYRHHSVPHPECQSTGQVLDERQFTVGAVLGERVEKFIYGFSDGWEHLMVVEKRLAADPERNTRPTCIAGADACPQEDVGGPPGYMDFVQAMRYPTHEQHLEMWRRYGGPLDPAGFDANAVNAALRKLKR
jgi:Plasmid pRiA4b ORF-3-like protein